MDGTITKRLHVSGLTPAITPDDLAQRFGSFGAVKAMDGFGLTDAIGQPRKFGYITLEATKKNLSRCLNVLSGVTWKGAKLRIGEAKADFRERLSQEQEAMKRAASDTADDRPTKRRRLPRGVQGVHAADMSLVTAENAASRPGWRVTALGRVVRPIRMRPEHPLPDPLESAAVPAKCKASLKPGEKKKKRVKDPPSRARRRKIDPTKWGSVQLKGIFLENAVVASHCRPTPVASVEESALDGSGGSQLDSEESRGDSASIGDNYEGKHHIDLNSGVEKPLRYQTPSLAEPTRTALARSARRDDTECELREEAQKSLGLLRALFRDKGDDDWGGKESVDSAVEEDDDALQEPITSLDNVREERDGDVTEDGSVDAEAMRVNAPENHSVREATGQAGVHVQSTRLKDLFAPRVDDACFSLLGHLDLDLELDEEVDLQPCSQTQAHSEPVALPPPVTMALSSSNDSKAPFFFPLLPEQRSRVRIPDTLDSSNWRTWFYRTDSEEAINRRWEEVKGELTTGWKRRHREAVKSRRRRGGGPGETEL